MCFENDGYGASEKTSIIENCDDEDEEEKDWKT